MTLVREHLAEELEVDPGRIEEGTRFKRGPRRRLARPLRAGDGAGGPLRDLGLRGAGDADPTVGDAVAFVLERAPAGAERRRRPDATLPRSRRPRGGRPRGADRGPAGGAAPPGADPLVLDRAPGRLLRAPRLPRRQRARALGRRSALRPLPRRRRGRPDQDPQPGGQSGCPARRSGGCSGCRRCCARTSPTDVTAAIPAEVLLDGERPLPEATEALIGACHVAFGFERTAAAVAAAFEPRIELASETRIDFKTRPAGAAGAARGARKLRGDGRHGPAAPAHIRGGGDRRFRAGRVGRGAEQEGGRAGGGRAGAEGAGRLGGDPTRPKPWSRLCNRGESVNSVTSPSIPRDVPGVLLTTRAPGAPSSMISAARQNPWPFLPNPVPFPACPRAATQAPGPGGSPTHRPQDGLQSRRTLADKPQTPGFGARRGRPPRAGP